MNTIIVGPSHIVRWQDNIRKAAIPAPPDRLTFIGFGGAPIWSKQIRDNVAKEFVPGESRIVLMVGDTRFGNGICEDCDQPSYPFADGFTHITRDRITPENDRNLASRVEAAIDHYIDRYGDAVRVIYWDMIGRRATDMLRRRNMKNGVYDHPSWGTALPGAHRTSHVIPLHDLFCHPSAELARLYIDDSLHPTSVAYRFLDLVVNHDRDVLSAFDTARTTVEAELGDRLQAVAGGQGLLIAGRSVWIDMLRRSLGHSGMRRMEEMGISTCLVSMGAKVLTFPEGFPRPGRCLFVSHDRTLADFLSARPVLADVTNGADIRFIPWEASLSSLFQPDSFVSDLPRSAPLPMAEVERVWQCPPTDLRRIIEVGRRAEPNWCGLTTLLDRAAYSFAQ